MTIAACVQAGVRRLTASGFSSEDARRDVSVLARHVLGWDVAAWIARQQDTIAPLAAHALAATIERRAAFEPVAYIIGQREFFGRSFIVTPDVLIPRPETELLVEHALAYLDDLRDGPTAAAVVDVGTGSGCIAVTLACERLGLRVTATDVSEPALRMAHRNAAAHGVADHLTFTHASLLGPLRDLDLVVSNPPYISESDKPSLAADVRDWEPSTALFGGFDGLAVIRDLIAAARGALRPGGRLMIEIGAGQVDHVVTLAGSAGFEAVQSFADLAGIARVVIARRSDLL